MSRYRELLEAAADELSSGGTPWTQEFYDAMEITVEDEQNMNEGIESGIRMLLMFADVEAEEERAALEASGFQPLEYVV